MGAAMMGWITSAAAPMRWLRCSVIETWRLRRIQVNWTPSHPGRRSAGLHKVTVQVYGPRSRTARAAPATVGLPGRPGRRAENAPAAAGRGGAVKGPTGDRPLHARSF